MVEYSPENEQVMEVPVVLSVAMLVSKERELLERILLPVMKFADEVVLVFTGEHGENLFAIDFVMACTDFDPRVSCYEYEWEDDFAKARNFSLSKCSGKYVMTLDPDLIISDKVVENILGMKRHLDPAQMTVYLGRYENIMSDGRVLNHTGIRCFPLREDVRFRYRVHEDVSEDVERLGMKKVAVPVWMSHIAPANEELERKRGYYHSLLIKDMEEWGETPRLCSMLANSHFSLGEWEKCVEYGVKAAQAVNHGPWQRRCMTQVFDSYVALKEMSTAFLWLDKFMERYPDDGMVHYLAGISCSLHGRHRQAVEHFFKAIKLKLATDAIAIPVTISEDLCLYLGKSLRMSGQQTLANLGCYAYFQMVMNPPKEKLHETAGPVRIPM